MAQDDLTPKQAAGAFKVHPETVRRWCRSGKLGYQVVKEGDWRIAPSEIIRLKNRRGKAS